MPHQTSLIATIAVGLALAFVFGLLAHRVRIPPLVGYLVAGVAVGPFTPGFVADQSLAPQLAEIGIILLMFGVGLHFSLKDLLAVRRIAVPGAVAQMAAATLLGMGLAHLFGWSLVSGFVFGLTLSVASTVVLLRALQERRIIQTDRGQIAVGWLIVEDLATVLALVLLPVLAQAVSGEAGDGRPLWQTLGLVVLKVGGFVAFMLVVGRRIIPFVLHYVAHTGSRELFRLAVLAIALGVALGAAYLFDVSFALGAFFAGMILSESELSQRAAAETLPLRDAFAVLFFVSVGMLFNPAVVMEQPLALLGTVAVIVVGKSIAAFLIVKAFRRRTSTALIISASLAQIGEFSFILAGLGVTLELLPPEGRDLVLAAAMISILLNPLVFLLAEQVREKSGATRKPGAAPAQAEQAPISIAGGHSVLIGYGRVGQALAAGLRAAEQPLVVVEDRADRLEQARADGFQTVAGNAVLPAVMKAAAVGTAERLFVAVPDGYDAGQIVEQARAANPELDIVSRAHSDDEVRHLQKLGADGIVMGEREIARGMLDHALQPDAFTAAAGGAAGAEPVMGPRASLG